MVVESYFYFKISIRYIKMKKVPIQTATWKGSGDRVPFHLAQSGSAHSVLQMVIYGSGDRVLFLLNYESH